MQTLLITYDLRHRGRDYAGLYAAIKQGSRWWHYLESVWVVTGHRSADEVYEAMRPHLDANDLVFVTPIHANDRRQGWLPEDAWDWLRQNVAR